MIIKAYFFSKKTLNIIPELEHGGVVHSVFPHAINIILSHNKLLTFLPKEREDYRNPLSIVLDEENFSSWNIEKGDKLYLNKETISFNEKNIEIDISGKFIWDSGFRYFGTLLSPPLILKNIRHIKFFLKIMNWDRGMLPLIVSDFKDNVYTKTIKPYISKLETWNFLERNTGEIKDIVAPIIGLGDGLTPSGDDFLSGFMLILFYMGKYLKLEDKVNVINSTIIAIAYDKTNIISRHFLEYAAHGDTFFLLREIIKDTLFKKSLNLDNFKKLVNFGSTSGASILSGLIFGLEYIVRYAYLEN